jgi:hypothetical protein
MHATYNFHQHGVHNILQYHYPHQGYGEARGSIAAFLFILGGKYANASTGAPGIKLRKVGGPGLAQMRKATRAWHEVSWVHTMSDYPTEQTVYLEKTRLPS